MKNIVLFGGSNSVMVKGLQAGLKEYANVTNLALGGSSAIQNLYELCRERNQEAIKNADLIVTESNINEIDNHYFADLDLNLMLKHLEWLYAKLNQLNKPVCIVLLPYFTNKVNVEKICNMHRILANKFNFSIIDMQKYYINEYLQQFGAKFGGHQMAVVNRNIGRKIATNMHIFKKPKLVNIDLPNFKVITPNNLKHHGAIKTFNPKNSMFDEIVYRLEKDNFLSFEKYENYYLIGLHSWNLDNYGKITQKDWGGATSTWGSCVFEGSKKIVKSRTMINEFCEIQQKTQIIKGSKIYFNDKKLEATEYSTHATYKFTQPKFFLPYFDLISIFICNTYDEKTLLNIDEIPDNEIIKIDPELDFTHLVPNVEFFRDSMEFIDEYAPRLYGGIERHIQAKFINTLNAKIASLENENRILKSAYPSATKRVQNHLSYKLGRAMIENSKSIFGYFKMPFVLWQIKKEHRILQISQSLMNLPKIETLSDYKEALKYKNHLGYKLGQAMIKATKTWYKGGFIKLIFEVQKIKKEHKK